MEHHYGNLYWPTTWERSETYTPLTRNLRKNVAIIGGGMSGSICAHTLIEAGLSTVILERDEISGGSTSANTGLLQYANDVMLYELCDQIGTGPAVQFYAACRMAVHQLRELAARLPQEIEFVDRSSLYLASSVDDVPKLQREYEMLTRYGFDVEYWSAEQLASRFPFTKPAALLLHGDAEVNPYRFVRSLMEDNVRRGVEVYNQTEVVVHRTVDGQHLLETANGHIVEADHVVYAIGYEPEELRGQLIKADINRSYAAVTAPQHSLDVWPGRYMIWETARPYLYMRTTQDGRVVVGGLDEEQSVPVADDHARARRIDKLERSIRSMFPTLDQPIEYEWCAAFGESRDNLPFIGSDPSWPGVYYCLGYGGNGTVYSMLASGIVRDLMLGREPHPVWQTVRLDRPSLAGSSI
ncbi:NAD(P)/FAD-dependent oxidoreductase [Paenibacillus sp. 1P07SE]|uniref:NAD(P)/FAD-dependent oxidoreductase n=1 Tax=Paenibacillus sp. 1P07SE TaxID=3132209 RepID=UPI0039A6F6F1